MLTLLLLSFPIWLYTTNPKVQWIFSFLFNNESIAIDLAMKYNAATAVIGVRMEN